MKIFSFEKLDVYKDARSFVGDIYKMTALFPVEERWALSDQLHRAAVSITSNVAEGTSRTSVRDKAHFIEMAYGSLMEIYSQLQIALDLEYITEQQYEQMQPDIERLAYELQALRNAYMSRT